MQSSAVDRADSSTTRLTDRAIESYTVTVYHYKNQSLGVFGVLATPAISSTLDQCSCSLGVRESRVEFAKTSK